MNHQELRDLVRDHFAKMVSRAQTRINADGPLSQAMQQQFRDGIATDVAQLEQGFVLPEIPEIVVSAFLKEKELEFSRSDAVTDQFARLIMQGRKSYYEAALALSDAAETFDFQSNSQGVQKDGSIKTEMTLSELVDEHRKYAHIEKRWTDKTDGERSEHIALLYERLGKDLAVRSVGREQAQLMRQTLIAYPVNRTKNMLTRGKPLLEVLDMTGIPKLHPRTVMKYLQTYKVLFKWAEQNGYCEKNPFDGISLSTKKSRTRDPRIAFDDNQLNVILNTVLRRVDIKDHHKWGTLIGIYSGARLNEIAQLHLDDVHRVGDVWCFDINEKEGTTKRLKNPSSKRLVPIHPHLMRYGFMDYFDSMVAKRGNQRLFPQLTYTKSDGYGRNLGRWFNETLLPELSIKTDQLTFHSLRHTMVRKLFAAEVANIHVMAIVGHEQGTTTLDTYNRGGFPPSQLLAALERAL